VQYYEYANEYRQQDASRAAALFVVAAAAPSANAAPTDCLADCMKNCKLIAPKDDGGGYCRETATTIAPKRIERMVCPDR
jgi:hypothetical protein